MKSVFGIIAFVLLFAMVSCRDAAPFFGRQPVARVGDTSLYEEEVSAAIPKGMVGEDSLSCADSYVERWVIRQLKLQEAELIFSSSEADIDKMVEEYRQSLLIRKIEQYYLDIDSGAEVSDEEIEKYYKAHKGDFRLTTPVVKGCVVAIPDQFRRRDWLLGMMRSPKSEVQNDFEQICLKNNFRFVKFEEWVDYNEFLSLLPLLRSKRYDNLLTERSVQQISHDKMTYCFKITDVIAVGDPMPLFMARDKIVRILTRARQAEVIRRNEMRILENATADKRVTILSAKPSDSAID